MLHYPNFNKIALEIGPFFGIGPLQIHWYGVMYLIGFAAAWWLGRRRAAQPGSTWTALDVDDFLFFAMLGVIFGGRIGYVLLYGLQYWAQDPWYPLKITQGGMSFHGGLTGVIIAIGIFAVRRKRNIFDVIDFAAPLPGIGLLAGRFGNFINNELWGRTTDVPWGVMINGEVRHATQLYEAALEGVVLFAVLWWFTSRRRPRYAPAGLFMFLYGCARVTIEFWRVPDEQIGYLYGGWLTMGHLLSLPMVLAGAILLWLAFKRREPSGNYSTPA